MTLDFEIVLQAGAFVVTFYLLYVVLTQDVF